MHFSKLTFFLIAGVLLSALQFKTFAQCAAPTSFNAAATNSTCASNGTITINDVSGGDGISLQYALYNANNTVEVRPWQTGNAFENLASGTYTAQVRYVCGTGFSATYTNTVTVGGNYTTPAITNVTVQRKDQCGNGRIIATGTGGTTPYTYALVSSQADGEPPTYIRPQQSSNVFDSLAAGTYYVRMYDACGSYTTNSVTINSYAAQNPFPNSGFSIQFKPCDSLTGALTTNFYNDYVAGTIDTIRKIWVRYPDGSTDTIKRNFSSGLRTLFNIPMEKWGTIINTEHFPNNIGGTWPKTVTAGFLDACGNTFTYDYVVNKPNYQPALVRNLGASGCDSGAYSWTLVDSANNFGYVGFPEALLNTDMSFSIDNGATWTAVNADNVEYSQLINMPSGQPFNACFAWCNDTVCRSGTIPNPPALNAGLAENPVKACDGNTGFRFYAFSGTAPVTVEMLSGPDGQTFPSGTLTIISTGTTAQELPQGVNLMQGTYVFRFTDACGNTLDKTITSQYTAPTFDMSYSFPCGTSNMIIQLSNYFYQSDALTSTGSFVHSTSSVPSPGTVKAIIYKASDSTPAYNFAYSSSSSTISIPSSVILSIPNGDYFIRGWRSNAPDTFCAYKEIPWSKTDDLISLSNSVSVSTCPGENANGTVVGVANGGSGAYSYSLYTNAVAPENLVAGPQASNIFNNLDADNTYILTVNDTCGRGTQASINFSSTPLPVHNNAGGVMPCPGDTLILSAQDMPNVTYQWYKDDVIMPNDTLNTLAIEGIEDADSGTYKVELNLGSCAIFLASFELNPDECGTPLPIELMEFNVSKKDKQAALNWVTGMEKENKGFEIQRSTDSRNWNDIGFVNSKSLNGNSQSKLEYDYLDKQPLAGQNFYRLKQTDFNGNYQYSPIRSIIFDRVNNITLHPNPANDYITLNGLRDDETLEIYDVSGKKLNSIKSSNTEMKIDISPLVDGVYQLRAVSTDGNATTVKFVKTSK